VRVENKHPTRLLHPLQIPKWKWETNSMNLIIGIPRMVREHYVIMVVVDKLRNETQFIPIKSTFKAIDVAIDSLVDKIMIGAELLKEMD
jgi:hypothetical protein